MTHAGFCVSPVGQGYNMRVHFVYGSFIVALGDYPPASSCSKIGEHYPPNNSYPVGMY